MDYFIIRDPNPQKYFFRLQQNKDPAKNSAKQSDIGRISPGSEKIILYFSRRFKTSFSCPFAAIQSKYFLAFF